MLSTDLSHNNVNGVLSEESTMQEQREGKKVLIFSLVPEGQSALSSIKITYIWR